MMNGMFLLTEGLQPAADVAVFWSAALVHYRLQITDYRLAPSKWGAREEPTSAPWATIEDTLSS
jgi:hypothetical protein